MNMGFISESAKGRQLAPSDEPLEKKRRKLVELEQENARRFSHDHAGAAWGGTLGVQSGATA